MAGLDTKWVVGLCLLALLAGCGAEQPTEKNHPRVRVQQVQSSEFAASVTLTGDVQARVQTDLSFRVGGKIIQRMVDVGDRVAARQVLARLDPKDLQTNVDSANAAVFAEQARVKQTSAAFVRQQKLLPKGYTSQSDYDSAQAQLANAREQLGYTALVAEVPGVITARQAEVGQVMQATQPIFSLAQDGERDAVFNVYESLVMQPPGQETIHIALLDNPKVTTTGKVREVTPVVSAQSGTVQVKVKLDSLPAGMELGSVVSATARANAKASVVLPWSALAKDLRDPAVWLVGADGKAQLHKVKVGRYLTGKVIISEGLEGGEQVVVAGGQLLYPGVPVEIAGKTTGQEQQP